jgi:diguanylate cyclase (GGDEF)-like protein
MRTIERIGLIDPLTKVSNRRGFEGRLNEEWGRSLRENTFTSILIMDIDKFKTYNDTYGHQQGDVALKAFAEVASGSIMRSCDFIARWGGEEFVILLPGSGADGAAEVAERVRKNIEATKIVTGDGVETKITVSIGINSLIPTNDATIKDFIEKADQALYRAKESGRNRYVIA